MIVAGFGFTSRATVDSLLGALSATGHTGPLDRIATASDKAKAPVFLAFAASLGAPVTAIDAVRIKAIQTATQSRISHGARGTGSVAEAAALAAAGPGAVLMTRRHISDDRMATCAIAKGADT